MQHDRDQRTGYRARSSRFPDSAATRPRQTSRLSRHSGLRPASNRRDRGGRRLRTPQPCQRNLQTLLSDITGKGYAGAYDAAQKQRLADIQAGQQGLAQQTAATQALGNIGAQQANYGLQNLQAQAAAGATQRGIEQEGLTADYNQYLRELQYPQQQVEFLRNMISGIPGVGSSTYYTPSASPLQSAAGGASTVLALLKALGQA